MRLLLDTHVMLWWAVGDAKLSRTGRSLIADESSDCAVSTVSIWEIAIKSSLKRGLPTGVTALRYASLVDEAGFSQLDIHREHLLKVEALDHIHGDPFDRLLIAQSQCEGMTLLTHDKALSAYGDFVIIV